MTAQPRPSPAVDRGERVFRSAERLIASAPPRRARRRGARVLCFIVGVVCGLGLAVLLVPRLREAVVSAAAAGHEAVSGGALGRRFRTLVFSRPEPQTAAPVGAESSPAGGAASESSVADTSATISAPGARPATARTTPTTVAAPAAGTTTRPPSVPVVTLAPLPPRLHLSGALRDTAGRFTDVAFELELQTEGRLTRYAGQARTPGYIARTTPLPLSGLVTPTAITLLAPAVAPAVPAYTFIIDLPSTPEGVYTGIWQLDGRRGTFILRALP